MRPQKNRLLQRQGALRAEGGRTAAQLHACRVLLKAADQRFELGQTPRQNLIAPGSAAVSRGGGWRLRGGPHLQLSLVSGASAREGIDAHLSLLRNATGWNGALMPPCAVGAGGRASLAAAAHLGRLVLECALHRGVAGGLLLGAATHRLRLPQAAGGASRGGVGRGVRGRSPRHVQLRTCSTASCIRPRSVVISRAACTCGRGARKCAA